MDYTGKRTDVVDFGGEMDYSHYQWFQDAPPRAPVSLVVLVRYAPHNFETQPAPPEPDYIPHPDVIAQNEAFEYALSCAPNILYGRYKQYGQVCVISDSVADPRVLTVVFSWVS
jgi:hypothetical protein